jgi:putative transposase
MALFEYTLSGDDHRHRWLIRPATSIRCWWLRGSGLNQVKVLHRPRLLSDNGPSYVSSELGEWLDDNGIRHIRGRPYHPMTQGKIERAVTTKLLASCEGLPGQARPA